MKKSNFDLIWEFKIKKLKKKIKFLFHFFFEGAFFLGAAF